jgi:hypothetical protein
VHPIINVYFHVLTERNLDLASYINSDHLSNIYLTPSHLIDVFLAMEDAHTALLQLPKTELNISFFAVFDGHGGTIIEQDDFGPYFCLGDKVAKFSGERLHNRLVELPEFHKANYKDALIKAYLDLDQELLKGEFPNYPYFSLRFRPRTEERYIRLHGRFSTYHRR